MPRGIPNAKRDDTGIRYTTFHVPLATNPKHVGTTYLKSEGQSMWFRNAQRKAKDEVIQESRRGSQVIVLHLGSRFSRIGRASDVTPVTVPTVVARKSKAPVPPPIFVESISRPHLGKNNLRPAEKGSNKDEYEVSVSSDDPFDEKIAAITTSLRDRMRFYKLRVTPNAANIASTFNEPFKPEIIAEHNDPYRVDWIDGATDEEVFVGEKALRLADPQSSNFLVRWPISGSNFNIRDYPSLQVLLSDVETLLRFTLEEKFKIGTKDYKDFSVVLIIPDLYDRCYVRELVGILLVSMGFKQLCAQQESLAATYGAGMSSACVVDIGATTTSIACVDEGLVMADSRMSLNLGGDDITEFLYVLLERISFPYKEINLARSYDWNVMEDLKARLCTLLELDVALNLYDFVVRRPGSPAEKYGLRAYDEIILAPMVIFEPRVIEFDRKRIRLRNPQPDVTEEILEHPSDRITSAMMISTQHLLPGPSGGTPALQYADQKGGAVPVISSAQPLIEDLVAETTPSDGGPAVGTSSNIIVEGSASGSMDVPMEVIDIDLEDNKSVAQASPSKSARRPSSEPVQAFPGGFGIDVCFEASKLPLDVAIFNSARASGGDEKIRKYLQAVLVIGGTARISGMGHALESRLQAIATPLVQNMEKVQIIPPPKDVDPRVLAWKGGAVLGKMDGAAELWVTQQDWDILGMRGLKERCFYL
ncbi:actin-like ATPase domain-containing protein [Gymnopus androsaceus JB14]|uniref:Actin-like ATPase domain-containing protein n=1 Tax=Gymnopus androsaceus JB14 TaxID=1447944 RepID=A0A6A4HS56_9AGAR|nr:actin-like ATPase domain-containing protein [Gymnopus androsaceus JB14]